jgi:predicted exporter
MHRVLVYELPRQFAAKIHHNVQVHLCCRLANSLLAVAGLLLVVFGSHHVLLLNIVPLSLFAALARAARVCVMLHTPRLMAFQIFSEPVSKPLSSCSVSCPCATARGSG